MPDWHFGYEFLTDVVGESNYQNALDKCYKDENAFKKGRSAFVDVDLMFEPENPYDANAVAVISKYGKIGYLSRDDAISYRHLCEGRLETLSVRCKIYRGNHKMYGAWVDLDFEELNDADFLPPPIPHTGNGHDKASGKEHENTQAKTIFYIILIILAVIAISTMD